MFWDKVMWYWLLFLFWGCSSTEKPVNTPMEVAREFIENLSHIDKVKALFPEDDVAKELLSCDGENQIIRDKQRIFANLDANATQFNDVQSKFSGMKYIETKEFSKGLQLKNCTFTQTVESRKYLVTATLTTPDGTSTEKTKRIIVIKVKSKWMLMSI